MQRILILFAVVFCLVSGAGEQSPSVATGWQRVLLLKAGSSVHVKTMAKKSMTCKVGSVDDSELVCTRGSNESVTLKRTEIQSIKMAHRGRSALTGLLVGAGIGAGIGAGVGHSTEKPGGWFNGLATGVAALAGGVIGGIVGVAISTPLDITAGSPIYQAP